MVVLGPSSRRAQLADIFIDIQGDRCTERTASSTEGKKPSEGGFKAISILFCVKDSNTEGTLGRHIIYVLQERRDYGRTTRRAARVQRANALYH